MYEIFQKLCEERGITPYRFCKDTGINSSTISTWKNRNTPCNLKLATTIAEYFGISVDYLMTGNEPTESNSTTITKKDERDIAKTVNDLMGKLESNDGAPLFFDGTEMSAETRILFEQHLKSLVTTVKEINKVKFNPNKNKNKK